MRIRSFAALLLGLLPLTPAWADTVYLANGRTFENVIAETTDDEVKIRMAVGSLSLPRNHVLRVESSDSSFGEYVRRKEAIRRGAPAADWLALARWAREQGLEHGSREAALAAANLDPQIEGLAPLLRGSGYVYDKQLDRWIPYADSMRRRGFVSVGGQWVTREEHLAQQRAREEEMERRRADMAAARAARATQAVREVELAIAHLELKERLRKTDEQSGTGLPLYVYPGYWYAPPTGSGPCHGCGAGPEPPPSPEPRPQPRTTHGSTVFHVPGSLLPGNLGTRSHRP